MKSSMKIDLIRAINQYDSSEVRFEILKDIVCQISDNKDHFEEPLIKDLLYIAAQKMRTFGYNFMNKINIDVLLPAYKNNQSIDFVDIESQQIESFKNDSIVFQNEAIYSLHRTSSGILLDAKQIQIIDSFQEYRRLLVSAPTSFGKTFILREVIFQNYTRFKNIILVFPTVSLLNENVLEFNNFIRQHNLDYKIINTTQKAINYNDRNIFIFTPERVLQLLNEHPGLYIDFFFMDEVYKIDNSFQSLDSSEDSAKEEERDKVFRIVLYILSKLTDEFYLAGPYINTSKLGEGFKRFLQIFSVKVIEIRTEMVKKEHIPSWNTKAIFQDQNVRFQGASKLSKLIELLQIIEKNNMGKSIIYAESKKKVSTLAREIVTNYSTINTSKLDIFIDHLVKRYSYRHNNTDTHKSWTIVETLKRAIGLHHGAFPKYIQSEILELYNEGPLNVLICTTSVTEGVNTKAKNVIFYGVTKGGKELRSFDIKNINGRAGRYYHHFIGRVFYLDKKIFDKLQANDDVLDFITYGYQEATNIDLDIADSNDLTEINKNNKQLREDFILNSGVDPAILDKNKLMDKYKQIEFINILEKKSSSEITRLVYECSTLKSFLENGTIYKVLGLFSEIELITEFDVRKFGVITSNYSNTDGMYRLLKYHFDKVEEIDASIIDSIYTTVFSDIRNIVEYKVPKYLSIFSILLKYVCSLPQFNINSEKLALDFIIRFFEIGVQSEIGTQLAENGFPIATIKILEKNAKELMKNSFDYLVTNYSLLESEFIDHLDAFELYLLKKIVRT